MREFTLYVALVPRELIPGSTLERDKIAQICLASPSHIQTHDLMRAENGFDKVEARYYGLTEPQRADIVAANQAIARYIPEAAEQMARIILSVLNTQDGDIASISYQSQANGEFHIAASTLMAKHALAEIRHKWGFR